MHTNVALLDDMCTYKYLNLHIYGCVHLPQQKYYDSQKMLRRLIICMYSNIQITNLLWALTENPII